MAEALKAMVTDLAHSFPELKAQLREYLPRQPPHYPGPNQAEYLAAPPATQKAYDKLWRVYDMMDAIGYQIGYINENIMREHRGGSRRNKNKSRCVSQKKQKKYFF